MKKKQKENLRRKIQGHTRDKEYILNYIQYNIEILEFIDKELLKDTNFVEKILMINGLALKYMTEEIKANKRLVIIALKNSAGFALKYASENLKADREVVKEAIKKWRSPLKYASFELQQEFNQIINDYYKKHKM